MRLIWRDWIGAGLISALLVLGSGGAVAQSTVREFTRIEGEGESVLVGIGLVTGLNATGDSGQDLAVARPLAQMMSALGNEIADFSELAASRSVALVLVRCTLPPSGARVDDKFAVRVSVLNNASSLRGGELFLTPLRGPRPGDGVFAMAQGSLMLESAEHPTTATVDGGARMVRDVVTSPRIAGGFRLVLKPGYSGFAASTHVAQQINDTYFLTTDPSADRIATAVDERTIVVSVPEVERAAPAAFVADVMRTPVSSDQLGKPATVMCNTHTGTINVDGDVRISPAIVTHRNLTITTIVPEPEPDPAAPQVVQQRWARLGDAPPGTPLAGMQDLIDAFNQLNIDPVDQIEILRLLHQGGNLHARLIINGEAL